MTYVRIVATYNDDERQKIIIVGPQKETKYLASNIEMFGYIRDWSEEENNYVEYPFILRNLSEKDGIADWGAFDTTKTILNLYGRRIAPGEAIERTEDNVIYNYTISAVTEINA